MDKAGGLGKEEDQEMLEVEDEMVLLPISAQDDCGFTVEKIFRVNQFFYSKLLMSHQKVALKWLLKQNLAKEGSFLADEMGLGKTISAIALLVTLRTTENYESKMLGENYTSYPVLVVCPATVIQQWQDEIKEWTKCTTPECRD